MAIFGFFVPPYCLYDFSSACRRCFLLPVRVSVYLLRNSSPGERRRTGPPARPHSRAGGRIRVVLDEMQVPVRKMRVQPRGHFQRLVAGVDRGQHLLRGQQVQARQQCRLLSTICSMRSMAQMSASPLLTSESYWRRETKFGRRKGQTSRPPAESLPLSMRWYSASTHARSR